MEEPLETTETVAEAAVTEETVESTTEETQTEAAASTEDAA